MSATPPSCFDWCRGSGYAVNYGSSTMLTDHPTRTYAPASRIIEVIPSGGHPKSTGAGIIHGYYRFLDTRFDTPPSGWNAEG